VSCFDSVLDPAIRGALASKFWGSPGPVLWDAGVRATRGTGVRGQAGSDGFDY